jgi:16S rRNA processing protein RimM
MSGERRVLLGKVVGVFGVRGWSKIQSHTEPRDALFGYLPWTLCRRGVEREIREIEGRAQGRGLVAHFAGVDTREQAESLVGDEIWVPRSVLPLPRSGEYYWIDLEGLAVRAVDGTALGKVSHLFSTGANDVLVVRDDERERLIPFLADSVIRSVDFDAGTIEVDWDPGF